MSRTRKVVSKESLPAKLVWYEGAVLWLLLDRLNAAPWVRVVVAIPWVIVLLWRGYKLSTQLPIVLWPEPTKDPTKVSDETPAVRSARLDKEYDRAIDAQRRPDLAATDVAPTNLERGHT